MKNLTHYLLKVLAALCSLYPTLASPDVDLQVILDRALEVYAPVSPVLGDGPCRIQGMYYRQAVRDGQEWALNMFDSSSKLPSGVLTGNLIQFGNFDQCLKVQHSNPEIGIIHGQHCTVHIGAKNFFTMKFNDNKIAKYRSYQQDRTNITRLLNENKIVEAFSKMGATLSVCVPAACSPRDLQLHLRTALRGWLGDTVNISVPHQGCSSRRIQDTTSAFSLLTSFLAFDYRFPVILFIVMVFVGSAFDLYRTQESRYSVLVAFSAFANFRSLTKSPTSSNVLPVLDGIRVISILMIMMFHHFFFQLFAPKINFHENMELEGDWAHIVFTNGTIGVDSFILLAGTLIAYNYLADRKKGLQCNPLTMYLRRYIRITPTVKGVIILKQMVVSFMDNQNIHPPDSDAPTVDVCKNFWWQQYLYITNNLPHSVECTGELWYVSLDMQLVWISPLFLYPLWRWPRLGKSLIGVFIFAGIALNFGIVSIVQAFYPENSFNVPQQRYSLDSLLYPYTYARFVPWFIGFILGYILHKTKKSSGGIPKVQVALGCVLSMGLMMTSLLYIHELYRPDVPYSMVDALYLATMRPAWATGLAILIILCVRGYGGPVNKFLSSPKFLVPSRLTFAVYLSNSTIYIWIYVFRKHPVHYDDATMIVELIGFAVISFGLGLLVHIFVEAPAFVLGKAFLDLISKKIVREKPKCDEKCLLG